MSGKDLKTELDAAIIRHGRGEFIGHIKGYCKNVECSARHLEVFFKIYGVDKPTQSCCPFCGSTLDVKDVLTFKEEWRESERSARCSVNTQLNRKRTGGMAIPVKVLLDDSLPE